MYPNNTRRNMQNAGMGMTNITDYGPDPFVVNIDMVTKQNQNYRTALWTGKYLQTTLMSIPPGGDIGLEMHPDVDQFIRVEDGIGVVQMGSNKDKLNYQGNVDGRFAIFVPAGTWHNVINMGSMPLKVYTIYAPPHHPSGTVQATKKDAEEGEAKEHK
ncbi:cupin domain-containing protein [Anaerotignum sp.]|uniref:cupin domain-containing protein n=1 Tax=Anaerotignum sp. TaxID=2039241 RepID=UPI002ED07914